MLEILYGRNPVYEAIRAGRRRIHSLTIASGAKESRAVSRLRALAHERGIEVRKASRRQLDRLGTVNHQGVAAEVGPFPYANVGAMFDLARERQEPPLLLLLDCLQNPQNLGTLLRTAEAVGVHGVAIPRRRAVEVTPAVCNASAGAVEHLRVAHITNLVRFMAELKERGVWMAGVEDLADAEDYRQANLQGPLALVLGSEGQGLRRLVRERCDIWIRLPMRGKVGSLNVAVAGSVVLYEAWQQRMGSH